MLYIVVFILAWVTSNFVNHIVNRKRYCNHDYLFTTVLHIDQLKSPDNRHLEVWAQADKTTVVCKKCNYTIKSNYDKSIITNKININLKGDKNEKG